MTLKYNLQIQEALKKGFQKKLRGDLRFTLWNENLLLWVHFFKKNFSTSLKYSSHGEIHLWLFWSLFTTFVIKEEPLCPSRKKPKKLFKEEIHHPCLLVKAKKLNLFFLMSRCALIVLWIKKLHCEGLAFVHRELALRKNGSLFIFLMPNKIHLPWLL